MNNLYRPLFLIAVKACFFVSAQDSEINNFIFEGNKKASEKEYFFAETDYRKALSESPERNEALHNLGNVHFENGNLNEASQRFFQAQKFAPSKAEKHLAFHNMGNVFMKKKDYAKAVEAYKNALRNNPNDDETRYNYALAKELLEKEKPQQQEDQQDQNKDNQQDKQEQEDQENKDKKGEQDQKSDQNDKGDQGEQKEQNGEPDEKEGDQSPQNRKSNQEKQQPPPPREGQLSPQQVQSLLEAMNNQEKDVQKKINAQKVNTSPVRRKKDW